MESSLFQLSCSSGSLLRFSNIIFEVFSMILASNAYSNKVDTCLIAVVSLVFSSSASEIFLRQYPRMNGDIRPVGSRKPSLLRHLPGKYPMHCTLASDPTKKSHPGDDIAMLYILDP